MNESREALENRRNEILAQLRESSDDLQIELDRDPEEQAIQLEQFDVPATFAANLAQVEEQLDTFDG